MTFDYPTPSLDNVLAYIDEDGDLRLKVSHSTAILLFANTSDGTIVSPSPWDWDPKHARRLFRAGDTLTIRF